MRSKGASMSLGGETVALNRTPSPLEGRHWLLNLSYYGLQQGGGCSREAPLSLDGVTVVFVRAPMA